MASNDDEYYTNRLTAVRQAVAADDMTNAAKAIAQIYIEGGTEAWAKTAAAAEPK